MANLDERMRARIEQFANELTDVVRQATLEKLSSAFALPLGGPRPAQRGRDQGSHKRTADEIDAQCRRIVSLLERQPGQRAEEIATRLGTTAKGLTLAMKKLLASRQITRKGQKRATQYFPATR